MVHALVLNATYEPLCVVTQRRALLLVLARKALALEASATVLHSASTALAAPSVVRLVRFVLFGASGFEVHERALSELS